MNRICFAAGVMAAVCAMAQAPAARPAQEAPETIWEDSAAPQRKQMAKMPPCLGKPDLQVAGLSLSNPLVVGQNVNTVTVKVKNGGMAPAGNFFVKAELCPMSGACSGGQFPLALGMGTLNGTLAAGGTALVPIGMMPYIQMPAAKYRIRITLDPTNMVLECNETNNVRTTLPLQFGPHCTQVDLISTGIGSVPVVPAANSGQVVKVSLTVFNQGSPYPGTPAAQAKVLLVNNGNLSQQYPVWTGAIGALTTGQMQHYIQFPVTIPNGLASGMYRWRAIMDSSSAIAECNEGNNLNDQMQLIKIN